MNSKDVRNDHKRLLNNLKLLQKLYSAEKLMEVCGIKRSTWFNKMKEPWRTFSYDDFCCIAKFCNVDLTTLLDGELKLG